MGLREKQHDHSVIKILAGMRQRLVRKGDEVEQFQLSHGPERGQEESVLNRDTAFVQAGLDVRRAVQDRKVG